MTMMTCPSCRSELRVTHVDDHAEGQHRLPDANESAHVRGLIADLDGRLTSAEIRAMYDRRAAEEGWPELSDKALGRRLRAAGATSYRTATERGWDISATAPHPPQDLRSG